MKKIILAGLLIGLLSCTKHSWENTTIAILPLNLDTKDLFLINEISKSILENPEFKVVIMDTAQMPKSAWYEPRKRYHANEVLKYLKKIKPDSIQYLLAITSDDISITKAKKDWGIFGLGYEPGVASVVSVFRLGKNKKQLIRRVLKICKHELGHNFGLPHCTHSKTCVMNSAEGSIKTVDRVSNIYCKTCKEKLRNR